MPPHKGFMRGDKAPFGLQRPENGDAFRSSEAIMRRSAKI
jgi:hypothetical protein